MIKKKFYKIIIFYAVFMGIVSFVHIAHAADIKVVPASRAGIYDVFLDVSPSESINGVQGTIIFNEDAKVIPSIDITNSIIPLWVQNPTVSGNAINFSGIIPGGFSILYDQFGGPPQMHGKLFSISFPFAADTDSYTFAFDSTFVYLNDGSGREVGISPRSITLPTSTNQSDFLINTRVDTFHDATSSPYFNVRNILILCVIFIVIILIFLLRK